LLRRKQQLTKYKAEKKQFKTICLRSILKSSDVKSVEKWLIFYDSENKNHIEVYQPDNLFKR
jgi:hypothetical protein